MRLQCMKIKILERGEKFIQVEFLILGIIMPIAKSILESKIKNGFYEVVK